MQQPIQPIQPFLLKPQRISNFDQKENIQRQTSFQKQKQGYNYNYISNQQFNVENSSQNTPDEYYFQHQHDDLLLRAIGKHVVRLPREQPYHQPQYAIYDAGQNNFYQSAFPVEKQLRQQQCRGAYSAPTQQQQFQQQGSPDTPKFAARPGLNKHAQLFSEGFGNAQNKQQQESVLNSSLRHPGQQFTQMSKQKQSHYLIMQQSLQTITKFGYNNQFELDHHINQLKDWLLNTVIKGEVSRNLMNLFCLNKLLELYFNVQIYEIKHLKADIAKNKKLTLMVNDALQWPLQWCQTEHNFFQQFLSMHNPFDLYPQYSQTFKTVYLSQLQAAHPDPHDITLQSCKSMRVCTDKPPLCFPINSSVQVSETQVQQIHFYYLHLIRQRALMDYFIIPAVWDKGECLYSLMCLCRWVNDSQFSFFTRKVCNDTKVKIVHDQQILMHLFIKTMFHYQVLGVKQATMNDPMREAVALTQIKNIDLNAPFTKKTQENFNEQYLSIIWTNKDEIDKQPIYSVQSGREFLQAFEKIWLKQNKLDGSFMIIKERIIKQYRHPILDAKLTKSRIKSEAKNMQKAAKLGLQTPSVFKVDLTNRQLHMQYINNSMTLKKYIFLLHDLKKHLEIDILMQEIGQQIAILHHGEVIHGDLTTSNIMAQFATPPVPLVYQTHTRLVFIDFGLSYQKSSPEDKAVDLYVLERAFLATHPDMQKQFHLVLDAYVLKYKEFPNQSASKIIQQLEVVRTRGRKKVAFG